MCRIPNNQILPKSFKSTTSQNWDIRWEAVRRSDQVELPISHLPIGCRDRSQIIDHHVLSKLMATRWKSLEETGDPCSAAAVSEETFEQVLTSKLDALNYSGSI